MTAAHQELHARMRAAYDATLAGRGELAIGDSTNDGPTRPASQGSCSRHPIGPPLPPGPGRLAESAERPSEGRSTSRIAHARSNVNIAPRGQLVMPGHQGQLNLDGHVYAPGRALEHAAESSPEGASPYLGTYTDFCTEPPGRYQLALPLDAFETAPLLSKWRRLEHRNALVRGTEFNRETACMRVLRTQGKVHVVERAMMVRSRYGAWRPKGVFPCGAACGCPVCGPMKARKVTSKLAVAMQRHLAVGPWSDCAMLTLAPPHGTDVVQSVANLYAATNALFRTREWCAFVKRTGLVGKVRVPDATHGGANGSHPHFHVALFVQSAWMPTTWTPTRSAGRRRVQQAEDHELVVALASALLAPATSDGPPSAGMSFVTPWRFAEPSKREAYLRELLTAPIHHGSSVMDAWERCCRAVGVEVKERNAFRERSLKLTPAADAATYFLKWGLADEVGFSIAKDRSHLRLLDVYAHGDQRAGQIYMEWRRAMHGRQLVSGLGDVCTLYGVTDEDGRSYVEEVLQRRLAQLTREGKAPPEVRELEVEIRRDLFGTAMALGWEKLFAFCDEVDARNGAVQAELDADLARRRAESRRGSREDEDDAIRRWLGGRRTEDEDSGGGAPRPPSLTSDGGLRDAAP